MSKYRVSQQIHLQICHSKEISPKAPPSKGEKKDQLRQNGIVYIFFLKSVEKNA